MIDELKNANCLAALYTGGHCLAMKNLPELWREHKQRPNTKVRYRGLDKGNLCSSLEGGGRGDTVMIQGDIV